MRIAYQAALFAVVLVSGCTMAEMKDVPQSIWGSSTRVLEEARVNALTKTYDKNYWDCFQAATKTLEKKGYVIFKKDPVRGVMIVMGIPGAVNTTEVGVFFVELDNEQTRIELSSLSSNAKRLLAKGLFHGMDIAFGLAAPDKEIGFSEEEFQNDLTPEGLVRTIEQDGYSVPSKDTALDSLNALLEDEKFYDKWLIKYKDKSLSKQAETLIDLKEKSKDQIKQLNRIILQETYPESCPRIK